MDYFDGAIETNCFTNSSRLIQRQLMLNYRLLHSAWDLETKKLKSAQRNHNNHKQSNLNIFK